MDGATLTLTYDEDLDENSEPSPDAFSVTAGGTGRAVDGVSVSGSSVTLTLASAVTPEDTVTVSYTVPTDAAAPRIQDDAGNPAASFSDQDVENNTSPPANTPATGAPTITGTAHVGETLTVDTTAISDADGLDNVSYSYQWLADDVDITGATSPSYALVDADEGETMRVRVSFTDNANNEETLVSGETLVVLPSDLLWSAVLTADEVPFFTGIGYSRDFHGSLTSGSFSVGSVDYLIQHIHINRIYLVFGINVLPFGSTLDDGLAFTTGTARFVVADALVYPDGYYVTYGWEKGGLNWSVGDRVAIGLVRVNYPATGLPTIGGTVQVGETLTASMTGIDDADGLDDVTFTYQWLADGTEISGAMDPTYTLVAADEDKAIKVRVSFSDDADNQETLTSAATAAVDPDPGPITGFTVVDASDQSVEGALADGGTLALDDPDGGSFGIRADLESGATIGSMRLQLTGEKTHDQTENITPYSLYGDSGGNLSGESLPVGEYTLTATAYSEARLGGDLLGTLKVSFSVTGPATQQTNTPATGLPTISGTAQVGETLTVDTSGIDDADGIGNATFSYQWIAGTTDISGATGSTYAPLVADLGKTIKVRVSFMDGASNVETLTSEATAAVTLKPNSPATGLPAISGTAQVGETLTADISGIGDDDGLDNATFSYQWIAGTTDIAGATSDSYTLVADDVGKAIRVRVSFDDDRNFLETLTSEATATIVTPLTAEFQDVPDKHLGTGVFTFKIAFSEPISISYKTLRDDSLEVTNGSATKAKRVDGQSDLWEITVEPDSDAAVTVVLPITEGCGSDGAVCTRDGTKLSNRSELTVPGPAAANSPATGAPIISGTAAGGRDADCGHVWH